MEREQQRMVIDVIADAGRSMSSGQVRIGDKVIWAYASEVERYTIAVVDPSSAIVIEDDKDK